MAFAAWFGLLATALNLFPIGQLDGGHISYAVLGRSSTKVTLAAIGIAVVLTFVLAQLARLDGADGRDAVRVSAPSIRRRSTKTCRSTATRIVLAVVALVVFVLCFTPAPIDHRLIIGK